MDRIRKLLGDFFGLWRVCGPAVALKWIYQVVTHLGLILEKGNLQVADHAMGIGPFTINLKKYACKFRVSSPQAISGIREMYVRDVYLRDGWLRINDGDTVLDLGANVGDFTNLALSMGPNVRVISVEPSAELNSFFLRSVALNSGYESRVQLVRAFLGKAEEKQIKMISENAGYSDVPWMSEQELIERCGITTVDFIKCDIEGGEFGLLVPPSKLLSMTKSLAIEVHSFAGDVRKFVEDIESSGFEIGPVQRDPDGTVTFLAKRRITAVSDR